MMRRIHPAPSSLVWAAFGILLALLWAAYRVGIQTSVALEDDAARALAWPNPDLSGLNSYTRTSPVGPILFKLSSSESPLIYLVIHVVAGLVAIGLLSWWAYKTVTVSSNRVRGIRLVALAPITGMIFLSLGNYDPFTVIGIALALIAWQRSSRLGLVLAGVYLGVAHFEQAAVAVVGWSLAAMALSSSPCFAPMKRSPIWALMGVVAGKVLLSVYFVVEGINPSEGRGAYFLDLTWPRMALVASINHFPVLLLSVFAGLWAAALFVFFRLPDNRRRLLLVASLILPTVVSTTTLAQSRVFVMTTLPIAMLIITALLSDLDIAGNRPILFTIEGIAWIVVPFQLYVSTTTGQGLITTTNSLDFSIMFFGRIVSLS